MPKKKMTSPIDRLRRVERLRAMRAPRWVIKSEQVAMVLTRKGLKHYGVGRRASAAQYDLYSKHVTPLMEK